MVYFKDKSSPLDEHHLIILDDQYQPIEKGTMLAVYTPSSVVKRVTLRATHHELARDQQSNDLAPLRTFGRSVVEGDAKWDDNLQCTGEFHYTKRYWEWIEDVLSRCREKLRLINAYDVVYASLFTYDHNSDIIKTFCEAWCPLTNTLLTSAGELSISLWDLHDLAGLPMTGCLYDEVVPTVLELTGADEKGGRFIPRSNKYLLYAYHLLQSADGSQFSNVSIDKWVKFWSQKAIKYHPPPPRKEKKTVWPKSTYNPLGDIATHKRWSTADEALFAKLCIEGSLKEEAYLVAYLACWLCTFVLPGKDVNSIRPSTFKMASMMASGRRVNLAIPVLASIYEGDKFIIEPYNPHRFGRQFGYFQDVLGTLKYTRAACLEEGLCYWPLCVLSKSFSKVWLPGLPTNVKKFCSEAYKAWWAKVRGKFFDDNVACLISPKPTKITPKRKKHEDEQIDGGENNPPHVSVPSIVVKSNSQAVAMEARAYTLKATRANESASQPSLADFVAESEDEVQSINASEESKTSPSWTTTPPLGMALKGKQLPRPPAVSVFEVGFLSSIEDDVYLILETMRSFQKFDITRVEESLNTLHEQHLKEAKDRFQDVQAKGSEEAFEVQSTTDGLEHIEKEIVALKERRTSLCATLKGQKQLNHDAQAKVHEVEENIAALENTAQLMMQ
ncbi:UNVERIFIED_CONTAM: hypothetical protein Slati_4262800 [Sesamum latifolium]|uniref:Aminotransferase-like plant mobile domain-containing protein n=1 Tax=Sesamum latifolium TaxID=2727402 RepID=A0AAW2TC13_9LAMI